MKCTFCEKKFEKVNGLKLHIFRIHSKEFINKLEYEIHCFELAYGIEKEKIDEIINQYIDGYSLEFLSKKNNAGKSSLTKIFELKGIKIRNIKEANNCEVVKESVKKYFIEKFGTDNPSSLEEIKQKKKDTSLKNYGYDNIFKVPEIINKRKESLKDVDRKLIYEKTKNTMQERYGVENAGQIERVREDSSNRQRNKLAALSAEERRNLTENARKAIKYTSSLEVRAKEILQSNNYKFDEHVFLFGYNYDFLLGNLLIELQGDYWHANPIKYKKDDMVYGQTAEKIWNKDARKKKLAEKNGYIVLPIWEMDFNKMSDEEFIKIVKDCLDSVN